MSDPDIVLVVGQREEQGVFIARDCKTPVHIALRNWHQLVQLVGAQICGGDAIMLAK